jgi:hypothetical protein
LKRYGTAVFAHPLNLIRTTPQRALDTLPHRDPPTCSRGWSPSHHVQPHLRCPGRSFPPSPSPRFFDAHTHTHTHTHTRALAPAATAYSVTSWLCGGHFHVRLGASFSASLSTSPNPCPSSLAPPSNAGSFSASPCAAAVAPPPPPPRETGGVCVQQQSDLHPLLN